MMLIVNDNPVKDGLMGPLHNGTSEQMQTSVVIRYFGQPCAVAMVYFVNYLWAMKENIHEGFGSTDNK